MSELSRCANSPEITLYSNVIEIYFLDKKLYISQIYFIFMGDDSLYKAYFLLSHDMRSGTNCTTNSLKHIWWRLRMCWEIIEKKFFPIVVLVIILICKNVGVDAYILLYITKTSRTLEASRNRLGFREVARIDEWLCLQYCKFVLFFIPVL